MKNAAKYIANGKKLNQNRYRRLRRIEYKKKNASTYKFPGEMRTKIEPNDEEKKFFIEQKIRKLYT